MRPSAAIAVPTRSIRLDRDEQISLRQLRAVLGDYDIYLVLPEDEPGTIDGLPVKRVPSPYFRGPKRLNQQLMISPDFYGAFADYDYVLIHHLDSLVLSDELADWCEAGWDNVGAPWTRRAPDGSLILTGVGNGGFALRRVESCQRVAAHARELGPRLRTAGWFGGAVGRRLVTHLPRNAGAVVRGPRRLATAVGLVRGGLSNAFVTEDKWWSEVAPRLDPGFRIPPPEVALSFAIETNPRDCLAQNGGRLPFGCHKWAFHDRALWEPHVVDEAALAAFAPAG